MRAAAVRNRREICIFFSARNSVAFDRDAGVFLDYPIICVVSLRTASVSAIRNKQDSLL